MDNREHQVDEEYVDLAEDEVRLPDGRRLTDQVVDDVVAEVHEQIETGKVGRPSLSGGAKHSPQVAVRLPDELNERLRSRAESEGKRVSQVLRDAVEAYL